MPQILAEEPPPAVAVADRRGMSFVTRRMAGVAGLLGLLLAELLGLSYRFDGQALVDGGHWWGSLVAYARYLPQTLLAVAAASLVLGGRKLWPALLAESSVDRRSSVWPCLAAHLLAFALFVALTAALWEGPLGRSPWGPLGAAGWLAAGAATFGTWLAALLPDFWKSKALARGGLGVLLMALLVGLAASMAGRATVELWAPLSGATFWTVKSLLNVVFSGVVADPASRILGTSEFQVEIAAECSGFEGIGLIWVFLAAYLAVFRKTLRFPQALWLLPIGTAVMWISNALRIAALIAIGALGSPSVALGGFHSQAGWIAFNVVALGLVAVSRKARMFHREPNVSTDAPARASANPTAAYLVPMLALVGVVMLTQAVSQGQDASPGFDWLYPARLAAVLAGLWVFRRGREDAGTLWGWSWPAVGLGVLAFVAWMALEPPSAPGASESLADGLRRLPRGLAVLWLVARVVGSVALVPIAEELAFRGYLSRRLIAADFTSVPLGRFTGVSFVASSLLFGILHGRWIAGSLSGAIFAVALQRRGRLSDAILAHAVTNALIAAHVLSTGAWSLWL